MEISEEADALALVRQSNAACRQWFRENEVMWQRRE